MFRTGCCRSSDRVHRIADATCRGRTLRTWRILILLLDAVDRRCRWIRGPRRKAISRNGHGGMRLLLFPKQESHGDDTNRYYVRRAVPEAVELRRNGQSTAIHLRPWNLWMDGCLRTEKICSRPMHHGEHLRGEVPGKIEHEGFCSSVWPRTLMREANATRVDAPMSVTSTSSWTRQCG